MTVFLARRLLRLVVVLFGVSTLVFFSTRLTGDPATMMFGLTTTEAQIEEYRHLMGWDLPLGLQYLRFLESALLLDFGDSFYYRQDALSLVLERMPATLELGVTALLFGVIVGLVTGVVTGVYRDSWIDTFIMSTTVIWRSVPVFWLALMLIFVFSVQLRWLPVSGKEDLRSLVLPAFSLGIIQAAQVARMMRSSMVDVLSQDYIRTAQAKGLPRRLIITRHAIQNSLIPVITLIGLQVGVLLGGAVITETIFDWPGIGRLLVTSILQRDFPVVQAAVFLLAFGFVMINLLLDLIYPLIDPRILQK